MGTNSSYDHCRGFYYYQQITKLKRRIRKLKESNKLLQKQFDAYKSNIKAGRESALNVLKAIEKRRASEYLGEGEPTEPEQLR